MEKVQGIFIIIQFMVFAIIFLMSRIVYLFLRRDKLGSKAQERSKKRKFNLLLQEILSLAYFVVSTFFSLSFIAKGTNILRFVIFTFLQIFMLFYSTKEKNLFLRIILIFVGSLYIICSMVGVTIVLVDTQKFEAISIFQFLYPMIFEKLIFYPYTLLVGVVCVLFGINIKNFISNIKKEK